MSETQTSWLPLQLKIDWAAMFIHNYAHKHEVPCHRGDSLNALHNAFTLELDMSNSSLQIH